MLTKIKGQAKVSFRLKSFRLNWSWPLGLLLKDWNFKVKGYNQRLHPRDFRP